MASTEKMKRTTSRDNWMDRYLDDEYQYDKWKKEILKDGICEISDHWLKLALIQKKAQK